MLAQKSFKKKLQSIDGRDYANYQDLLGSYQYSFFNLTIQQIPKDPFAPPHTGVYRISVKRSDTNIINYKITSKIQRIAFADYLARAFYHSCEKNALGIRGTGYSGLISICQPSQIILERSSVIITEQSIEIRCFLGLPGKRRKVIASVAEHMLLTELPTIAAQSLLAINTDLEDLRRHIAVAEDSEYLRDQLDSKGLIAFIANGSRLPRKSGIIDEPLSNDKSVEFNAPENLIERFDLPNAGPIEGLGIRKGVNLIVGGGFHGKSTLLGALESGIYNHIRGDGREYCVTNPQAVKVRAYSGRRVENTNISPFVNHLPLGIETTTFRTENASGSTSQAANIMEAIEIGAEVLLMDEDTCATNFMVRDEPMQQLVNKKDEPITAFIDRVRQIYLQNKISSILILGGIGDYFAVSDQVIQMINYQPVDVTDRAQEIARQSKTKRKVEGDGLPVCVRHRIPLANSISPLNDGGKYKIQVQQRHAIRFGKSTIDLIDVEQLVELSQTKAIAVAINYAKKYMDGCATLREVVEQVFDDIESLGLDRLDNKISGHYGRFRRFELAFAINRLAGFKADQRQK